MKAEYRISRKAVYLWVALSFFFAALLAFGTFLVLGEDAEPILGVLICVIDLAAILAFWLRVRRHWWRRRDRRRP